MKFSYLPILLMCIFNANAQSDRRSSFGVFAGVGGGAVVQKGLDGAGSKEMGIGLSIAVNYYCKLSGKTLFETGIACYKNEVTFDNQNSPNGPAKAKTQNVYIVYVPVFLRHHLSKSFFLSGGLIADFDLSKNRYMDDQSGLGAGVGIGVNFPLSQKIVLGVNPFISIHGLLMIDGTSYSQRLLETGIRLGIKTY
ncbi:MAG: hypothetical protein E6Q96_06685 [Cyclobacteriaceae bacterium]|nr:MAG: hypothetical protein E6Q96_06685 [Cyclobacteriaceae bacterium]